MDQGFKTIAFPLLGAGGCGFPPRVAAREALREVRSFLDKHQDHPFEKIIFVAYSTIEERAFVDFLPVFFPPTHEDIENTALRGSDQEIESHAHLRAQLLHAHDQVEMVVRDLTECFQHTLDFRSGHHALDELTAIMLVLRSLEEAFSRPKNDLNSRSVTDIEQVCNVMDAVCSNIAEIMEVVKGKGAYSSYQAIWVDYNSYMETQQGLDMTQLLELCQDFVQCLEDMVVR
jgi:hypothetical protein